MRDKCVVWIITIVLWTIYVILKTINHITSRKLTRDIDEFVHDMRDEKEAN